MRKKRRKHSMRSLTARILTIVVFGGTGAGYHALATTSAFFTSEAATVSQRSSSPTKGSEQKASLMQSSKSEARPAKQAETPEQVWLMEHCAEYGFILRHPEGKEDMTDVIYKPWYYRYVGKEAAQCITERGLTREEYLGQAPEK